MKGKKNFLLDTILEAVELGKNPSQISKELKLTKQNLNYYIRQLKQKGLIQKIGYGVWERSKKTTKDTNDKLINSVRGHAFIWRIKSPKINWLSTLKNHNFPFEFVGIKKTPRIILNNKKIWLGKDIIIYNSDSFMGKTSFESKSLAIQELLKDLKQLEDTFNLNLKPYNFTTTRNHYSLVKNELAKHCNNKKEKIQIYENGKRWLVVDDSYNLGEFENEDNPLTHTLMQDWWNNQKETGFKVTPSFLLEAIYGVTKNQLMNSENIVKHQKVLDEMLITLKLIQKDLSLKNKDKNI